MAETSWLTPRPDGVEILVHVRPNARRSAIAGMHGAALGVRVAARPVDGAANDELVRILAEALGVSRSTVRVLSGARGRSKRLHVAGLDVAEAHARLVPHLSIDKTGGRD